MDFGIGGIVRTPTKDERGGAELAEQFTRIRRTPFYHAKHGSQEGCPHTRPEFVFRGVAVLQISEGTGHEPVESA